MDADDYEDVFEWSWTYDEVMYENGDKIKVVSSISNQNSGMCLYYCMRDILKSRKNIFEISCEESDADYYMEFGEDVSVQQLIDAVPRCPGSLRQLFEYVQDTGFSTDRCYNDLARQIPDERSKDLKGCPIIKIHEWNVFSGFGRFTKEKVMNIAREMEEFGPALGYFTCPSNLKKDLPSQFILKPIEGNMTTEGRDRVVRSLTHAVLLTGFGRAREKSSGKVTHYWIIQNNWGENNCPVARIPVGLFAEVHTVKFKNSIEITASPQLEVQAKDKAVREQIFGDYVPE